MRSGCGDGRRRPGSETRIWEWETWNACDLGWRKPVERPAQHRPRKVDHLCRVGQGLVAARLPPRAAQAISASPARIRMREWTSPTPRTSRTTISPSPSRDRRPEPISTSAAATRSPTMSRSGSMSAAGAASSSNRSPSSPRSTAGCARATPWSRASSRARPATSIFTWSIACTGSPPPSSIWRATRRRTAPAIAPCACRR